MPEDHALKLADSVELSVLVWVCCTSVSVYGSDHLVKVGEFMIKLT
jgi:hypothetical protein